MNDREALDKLRGSGRPDEALRYLYRRYAPRFYGYFLRHRLARRDAEALVEDAFVEVVTQCGEYFGESRADAWLWAIARSVLLGHFRSRTPQQIADDHAFELLVARPEAAPVRATPTTPADCARAAYVEFAAANADRAEMLAHVAFEGWTLDDMAVALRRTPEAACEYVAQSREKLRTYLEPCREQLPG